MAFQMPMTIQAPSKATRKLAIMPLLPVMSPNRERVRKPPTTAPMMPTMMLAKPPCRASVPMTLLPIQPASAPMMIHMMMPYDGFILKSSALCPVVEAGPYESLLRTKMGSARQGRNVPATSFASRSVGHRVALRTAGPPGGRNTRQWRAERAMMSGTLYPDLRG
jgi:hypothetical protein